MPRRINGPDGPVDFPDAMDDGAVEQAMQRLYPPKQAAPTDHAGVWHPSTWEQLKTSVPLIGDISDIVSGNKPFNAPMKPEDSTQLAYPERMFSQYDQAQHPIRTAVDQVAGSLTSPQNLLLLKGMGGDLGNILPKIASTAFRVQMGKVAYESGSEAVDAYKSGDFGEAKRLATHAILGGAMSIAAGAHVASGSVNETIPETPQMAERVREASQEPPPRPSESKPSATSTETPREPVQPTETMTRLYRGESVPGSGKGVPDWVKDSPKFQEAQGAQGRWFTTNLDDAKFYAQEAGTGRVRYLDVPKEIAEKYRATNSPEALKYSPKARAGETDEHFLPSELGQKALLLGDQTPFSADAKETPDTPKDRSGERGSLSFKPIPDAERPEFHPLNRLADVLDKVATLGGKLDVSPEEAKARLITREFAADQRLTHLQLEAKLHDAIDAHDNDGKTEFQSFMDAGEGKPGAQFLKPEDQAMAQELHNMFNERWTKVQDRLDKEPGGIENYLSHLWERPGLASRTINTLFGKTPIAGKAGFLKQRFYEYASDGLNAGLKPITWNPINMQLTALFQMDKFLAAHELKDNYAKAGLTKWIKLGDTRPEGWQTLHDKIFEPKVMEDGGLKSYGRYYAPADVAKIFNNYVDPGLRGNPTYDTVRSYGNLLNQVNLGVSGYHGVFITAMSGSSDVALGLERVFRNKDIGGVKNILKGTLGTFVGSSARADYKFGKDIQRQAITPEADSPLQPYVDALVKSGASFGQDPMYETNLGVKVAKTIKDLATGNLRQGAQGAANLALHPIETIKGAIQDLSKPIMKYYVPRIKLGMAAKLMEVKGEYLQKQGITDPTAYHTEMAKVWDSVDNRAGQMVYDNLFWNKVAKDMSFLTVRAVGWDYGSAREFGGAAKDTLQGAASILRGKPPEFSSRLAFTMGHVMTIGTIGAAMTYIVTGHGPRQLEDYFYPLSGRVGTNGKPERLSMPSYIKDAYSVAHAPGDTALHKLHPTIGQMVDLFQNKDFYGTEIRAEGDPLYKQGIDVLKWYGKSIEPFAISTTQYRKKSGVSTPEAAIESFFGFMPAPAYVTSSKAEDLALDLSKRNWKAGPISSRDREQRDTFNTFRGQLQQGKLDTAGVSKAFQEGKLRPQDLDRLFDDKGLNRLQSEFKALRLPDALKVMQVADNNEKQQLKPLLLDKIDQVDDFVVPEERAFYLKQLQKSLQ